MSNLAAIADRYGPPEVLRVATLPPPTPAPGQLLVRVHAASLNPLDTKLRAGELRPLLRLSFPAVLGFDFAGEVAGVGDGVRDFSTGDRVYGRIDSTTGGTHAQLISVGAGVADHIPPDLGYADAAALPLTAMTALQALEKARLGEGQRLLVVGAAGGVGSMAVQIGRSRGATVTGVASTRSAPIVERLGARVLDYTRGELDTTTERFDVVFDTVFERSWRFFVKLLEPRGAYVTTGFSPGLAVRATVGRLWSRRRVSFVVSRADGVLMRDVSRLVSARQLRPILDSTFPLDRITAAHRRMEEGHLQGKVVVTLPEPDRR